MKTHVLSLALALLTSTFLTAQSGWWEPPVDRTDSVSDNCNAQLAFVKYLEDDCYLFWEHSTDSLSTAVFAKNFYGTDTAHAVLQQDNVHFTNPCIYYNTNFYVKPDTSFFLLYESDESGTNRIYYRVYTFSNGFTDAVELTSSDATQESLSCSQQGLVTWVENDRVMASLQDRNSLLFGQPVVLDSGNCKLPTVPQIRFEWYDPGAKKVAWIKQSDDSSRVLLRSFNDQDSTWLAADTLYTAVQFDNLTFCSGFGSYAMLSWDRFDGSQWEMNFFDVEQQIYYASEIFQQQPLEPNFCSGFIPVSSFYNEPGFSCYVKKDNDSSDLYLSGLDFNPPYTGYENITQSGRPVRNPAFFTGAMDGCWLDIFNIWEEKINGHWVLRSARTYMCLSDIEEMENTGDVELSIGPNPFSAEVFLELSLKNAGPVSLNVYDLSGRLLETLDSGTRPAGTYFYQWDGSRFGAGMYFVSLQFGNQRVVRKIILNN